MIPFKPWLAAYVSREHIICLHCSVSEGRNIHKSTPEEMNEHVETEHLAIGHGLYYVD